MKENLKIGNVVDDGTGDYLREGGEKINKNFDEIYTELGDGSTLFPAGAWKKVASSAGIILNASFGKSYIIDTASSRVEVKLPKGTTNDYGKTIKLRDVFETWQVNNVTVTPANGDTLRGSSDSKVFNTNLTDLELVYCVPGRWQYMPNKLINKISNGDIATVMKKEFLCTEGQTDFLNVFGDNDFNIVNTHVYHRGNILFYGAEFSENSDYGSVGANPGELIPVDGKSIRLRDPAKAGDSLVVVTYLDGIAQWRSTYNRLDCVVLDKKLVNTPSVVGSTLVADLDTLKQISVEELGYTLTSNSGLINPSTFEVILNGVILNEAGKAGLPLYHCVGADASTQTDCQLLGGSWTASNTDYTVEIDDDSGAITHILFDRKFEHGDVITIKWYNNDIGTTMEIDDIIVETDKRYVQSGSTFHLTGQIRVTDFDKPAWPNVEELGPTQVTVRTVSDMFDLLYPIGLPIENALNPANPATYMGFGTWIPWGDNQVLVGWSRDNQDTQFGLNNNYLDSNGNPTHTAGGTGGVRNVTLTNDNLPASQTDEKVLVADPNGNIIIGGCQFDPADTGPAYNKYREERAKTNATHVPPKAFDTVQPYVTVYRWLRVA